VRFGVVPVIPAPLVSEAILATRNAHPETLVYMEARPQRELIARLETGHIDLVLGPLSDPGERHPAMTQTRIFSEELCVVASGSHPLAGRRGPLSIAELGPWDWLLPPTGSATRADVDRAVLHAGLAGLTPRLESEDVPFQMYTVATSHLLGVIPRSQAIFGGALGLRALPVDLDAAPTEVGVIYPAAAELSLAGSALIDALRTAAARAGFA
jgi:DNA-binding transcriptional LysR family regulator